MGELVNQLRKHIEEVGDAAFEQELFEFNCKYYGIDPEHPHARRKLKWSVFMEKVKDTYVPMVVDFFCIFCMIWLAFVSGESYVESKSIWLCIFYICGSLGWLNIYIRRIKKRYEL